MRYAFCDGSALNEGPLLLLDATDEAHFVGGPDGRAVDGRQIIRSHLRKRGPPMPQAHVGLGDNVAAKHRARVECQHKAVIVGDAVTNDDGRALVAGQFPRVGDHHPEAHCAMLADVTRKTSTRPSPLARPAPGTQPDCVPAETYATGVSQCSPWTSSNAKRVLIPNGAQQSIRIEPNTLLEGRGGPNSGKLPAKRRATSRMSGPNTGVAQMRPQRPWRPSRRVLLRHIWSATRPPV